MQAPEPEPLAPGADWPPEPGPPLAEPLAGPAPRRGRSRLWVAVRDFVEAVVLAGLLFFGLQLVMQNTVVKGVSMQPNYVSEQRVIVNKLAYRMGEPGRGDVIVFHAPGLQEEDFIKRIIALPGESVAVLDGVVYVNGVALDEPYGPIPDPYSFGPYTVPEGSYFVMGDNRPNSNDSRTWSTGGQALPRERIVGPVVLSVWPPETWGLVAADAPGPAQRGARAESP